jgi:hemerythrin superfamily protein
MIHTDHELLSEFLANLEATPDTDLEAYATALTESLVRHEAAEERILYPALRGRVTDGNERAEALLAGQAGVEALLAELAQIDPESTRYRKHLEVLKQAVIEHAANEEAEVLPVLQAAVTPDELAEFGQHYRQAFAQAPLYPHPHAPDRRPGNLIVMPVIAFVDHLKKALRK